MTSIITTRRKAVSPVIATVILIAVAVALGIAVAFWASGLTSSFSKYEKLGVNTQYAVLSSATCVTADQPCWIITLGGQNTGSSDATITQIQVNGVPYPIAGNVQSTYALTNADDTQIAWESGPSGGTQTVGTGATLSVPSGNAFSIQFALSGASGKTIPAKSFSDGQTIQVVVITAAGNNYPASIVLP